MEKEFSFRNYFVYIMRKWIIVAICLLIGGGIGAYYSLSFKTTNIAVYEGTIKFNTLEYVYLLEKNDDIIKVDNVIDYEFYNDTAKAIVQTATESILKTETFTAVSDQIYAGEKKAADKKEKFFNHLVVTSENNFVKVDFAYDIKSEADEAAAVNVVNQYLKNAVAKITASYPELAGENKALIVSPVTKNFDTEAMSKIVESNNKPSLFVYMFIGLLGGFAAGAVIATLVYAFDPRIKSVAYILPEDKAKVISAEKTCRADGALISLLTAVNASGTGSILLSDVNADENLKDFAGAFADFAEKTGRNVKLIELEGDNNDVALNWRGRFEGKDDGSLNVYVYDNKSKGVLGYVSGKVSHVCLIVNQADTGAKSFTKAVDEISGAGGNYLGTLLYNITDSYVG